ncbi:MAG: hypothetical protein CM15mP83_6770 [Flavobacteriaceae bacterium]|nr:MAG: hypothetical protein CM15mP83_6770 [Flavobacteriaceae bacterium]
MRWADGGPIVGGITITNLNISAPFGNTEPPVITLLGENPVGKISVGDLTGLVSTAQDESGDINSLITVGGNTGDTSTVGT